MTTLIVTTQEEMDAAIADKSITYDTHEIEVRSSDAIVVSTNRTLDIRACGSSTVRACDSSTVRACGSSTVRACGSSTVTACDSSTVRAYDSSTVRAYDSSTVRAYDSSTVRACDLSTVTACDSSTVRAYNSSTVRAYNSSTVTATGSVAIHKHNALATITGGVVIDHTTAAATTPIGWAEENGADVQDGAVTLYKALPADLTSGVSYGHTTVWPTSGEVSCDDWRDDDECGGGLHLSPTPGQAWAYLRSEDHPRFLECTAPLDSIVPILGGTAKCKASQVTVVREVDVAGRPVSGEGVAR